MRSEDNGRGNGVEATIGVRGQPIPDILRKICEERRNRLRTEGHTQGLNLPRERKWPLQPFNINANTNASNEGILIAEIKRSSPSRGAIAEIRNPVKLAGIYKSHGFRRVSVLTEQAHFRGALADLMEVKQAHPDLAVLRKDFLLDMEDVEVSWRAGADAILLIAAVLDGQLMQRMHEWAQELGLAALVEVHDYQDVAKVRKFRPALLGINSRDLRTFRVDALTPLETRRAIDWPCRIVYESGIRSRLDAMFVRGTGFSGFLVGETAARFPNVLGDLRDGWLDETEAFRLYGGWGRLFEGRGNGSTSLSELRRPLVKICGITNRADAEAAVEAGADMIGFVFAADSPRRVEADVVRACADLPVVRVGVVVSGRDEELAEDVVDLIEGEALDFIQFHGDEDPAVLQKWPSYKAVRLGEAGDVERMKDYNCPAILVDAFSSQARGGTGRRVSDDLLGIANRQRRLWIAGGLKPGNVRGVVTRWNPGLVDVSSGVEARPGVKDYEKLEAFMEELVVNHTSSTDGRGETQD